MPTSFHLKLLFVLYILIPTACNLVKKAEKTPSETTSKGMAYRRNVVQYAEKHVGKPYKYAGKSPSTGFDCSGFTSFVLKNFDISVSPASKEQAREGRSVEISRVQPGDLIFFGKSKNNIDHVAMVVRRSSEGIFCVHSTTSRGVIVENVSQSSYWKPRILFARDVIGK